MSQISVEPEELAPEQRLSENLKAYLEGALQQYPVKVNASTDQTGAKGKLWLEIDAEGDIEELDAQGVTCRITIGLYLTSHPSVVPAATHKQAFRVLRDALLSRPDPKASRMRASIDCLDAVNLVPGLPSQRPQSQCHLWDLVDPSTSQGQAAGASGKIMQSVLVVNAIFSPWDWTGAQPYRGMRGAAVS